MKVLPLLVATAACGSATPLAAPPPPNAPVAVAPAPVKPAVAPTLPIAETKQQLHAKYPDQAARIDRGVDQVAALWRPTDGDLTAFCLEQFAPNTDSLFARMEAMTEQIKGNNNEITRTARWNSEVDTGPLQPVEGLLASYSPQSHVVDDLFSNKVAFAILLNFPQTTLADRTRDGAGYSRRQWAEARLAQPFARRVPGELEAAEGAAGASADAYVAGYNLWMHHVLAEDGTRLFPSGKRLISHWNLRDELKANYAEKDAAPKQRTIVKLMERIVTQTIPAEVVDNPHVDWNPFQNKVAPGQEVEADAPTKKVVPDSRFDHVLAWFHAERAIDKFSPAAPTYIERAFVDADMPEARVRSMLVEILEAPQGAQIATLVQQKLGRPLEPQDLWYPITATSTAETELDAVTRKKYPSAAAFAKDIPRILHDLGFTTARAKYLSEHIEVDPSRGAGHAMEADRRGDKAHLRTRAPATGMDYKGYNIAVHELGHNIEQTFSLYDIDHTLLQGVPNIAFTEALAFLFQHRDRELLGRPRQHGEADRLAVIDTFWQTREIAGSALVEIDTWHWLYEHPNATATELRDATAHAASAVWDKYYAPLLGGKGTPLLAIYSHTIASPLYLFNYVLGHLIAFQVEQHLAGKDNATFGKEFERVARLGHISPDLWMTAATGKPVSTESLIAATKAALDQKQK